MTSPATSQVGLGRPPESQPIDHVSSFSLSKVARGSVSHSSDQENLKSQRTEALNDLNKLLKLVIEQDKKFYTRLSPQSNYYCQHITTQQFLQCQLTPQPSQKRRNLSLSVARGFL